MPIMKLYVKAKSKKEINENLEQKKEVYGINFSMFGDGGTYKLDEHLAEGTVITVYEKTSGGSPVGKSYGTWKKGKVA